MSAEWLRNLSVFPSAIIFSSVFVSPVCSTSVLSTPQQSHCHSLPYRSARMSSEALDLSGAMRPRNTPAPYWAFFTKEEAAFWSFADRSREDHIPSDLVVDSYPHMVRADQPLISR